MNISLNFPGKCPNWIFAKKKIIFPDDNGFYFSKTFVVLIFQ